MASKATTIASSIKKKPRLSELKQYYCKQQYNRMDGCMVYWFSTLLHTTFTVRKITLIISKLYTTRLYVYNSKNTPLVSLRNIDVPVP
ncbi:hypothetical protein T11_11845 [Trichinella zimbabwensis]|uniref:Uncharacterized protein n=1 Tax=Trichinella zimbabwensis TaxID=268475 RepID=A0A0V1I777_9BILA|nr:hypothetical protein T11_11845 [Trichinella zimbabwensis]